MSTEKPLSELSMDELRAKEKSTKSSVNHWIAIMALLVFAAIFNTSVGGFSTFSLLPLFFIGVFGSVYSNWKKVKEEIISRGNEI